MLLAVATATLCAVLAAGAQAATYTVGTHADKTGACASPESGKCSLRQLIEYENALPSTPSPADTIVVPEGKYELEHGQLTITQTLTIAGAGARTTRIGYFSDVRNSRIFDVTAGKSGTPQVVISGLEVTGGGAGDGWGGDIESSAKLTLDEDWVTNGDAERGGGISNSAGTLLVVRSLVSNNDASDAGGIQNFGSESECEEGDCLEPASLTVEDSTVAYNEAGADAGIDSWSGSDEAGNEVSVLDSTIAYNEDFDEEGGAAGLLIEEDGGKVGGSIIAYNDGPDSVERNCSPEESGEIESLGYNIENGEECGLASTGDLRGTDPEFSSAQLRNNGGETETFALEPTSPAVDAIPSSSPLCKGTDQRGIARPQGAGCDIGAVELVPFTIETTEGKQFSGKVGESPSCGAYSTPGPTIEWGDGQKSSGTVVKEEVIDGIHTYAHAGVYNGTVTYSNDCERTGPHRVTFQALVADAPLTASGEAVRARVGVSFSGTVATFTDANPDADASEYTASVEWGDGTSSVGTVSASGKGFAVSASHTYAAAGTYTIAVSIGDAGGSKATTTSTATVSGPPIVSNVSVLSVTETTATIGFTIDPDGEETSYVIDYGHTTGYGASTPPVDIGASPGPQVLTRTLTGLEPGSSYHFDVVAANSQAAEGVTSGDLPFATPAAARPPGSGVLGSKSASGGSGSTGTGASTLPPPVLGETVNVEVVSGKVLVSLPTTGQMSLAAPLEAMAASLGKGLHFVPLTQARQIPVGSTLETTHGVARVTTATATVGKTQSGEFGAGIFKLLQNRKQKGLTDLDIVDSRSARQVCASLGKKAAVAAGHLSSKALGRLTGSAHGKFTTKGQYSAATVRGTSWGVTNQCDGTLTRVTRGEVSVRDFRRRKTVTLFAGQHYLAKAPR